ncbi:lysoplasmalogenase [Maribacter polysiphoniae]|uniref:lysoplasmalogenase n=1 Tax=Maribacter polysiphoniae TaxID=429344 RepID=UPI002354182A|nr:lysoplasmalogenase [Maribacter polysiphoniae]
MNPTKQWFTLLVLAQVISAIIATATDVFIFKISVAALGAIILLIAFSKKLRNAFDVWVVILAFVCSMIGDFYLSHMNGNNSMFVIGISLYLLAHIGYLIFSLLNGTIRWRYTLLITTAFLIFFYFSLYPNIPDKTLMVTVLFYLIVSCVSLGAALGIKALPKIKLPYVFGIALVLFSDTIISFKEFVHYDALNVLILPTYYLAQIAITIALYHKSKHG